MLYVLSQLILPGTTEQVSWKRPYQNVPMGLIVTLLYRALADFLVCQTRDYIYLCSSNTHTIDRDKRSLL